MLTEILKYTFGTAIILVSIVWTIKSVVGLIKSIQEKKDKSEEE